MALTIPDDSYSTLEAANARIADTPMAATWDGLADDAARESYLRAGKRAMDDGVVYPGWPATEGQPWPREGVRLRWGNGRLVSRTTIPDEIGEANALQAAALAVEDRESDDVTETLGITLASGTAFSGKGGRKMISDRVRDLLHASGYGRVPRRNEAKVRRVARG